MELGSGKEVMTWCWSMGFGDQSVRSEIWSMRTEGGLEGLMMEGIRIVTGVGVVENRLQRGQGVIWEHGVK